jgi:uncharacterized protein (TIGR04222 family)
MGDAMFNPFDLDGPAFLELYASLIPPTLVVALLLPIFLRPEGGGRRVLGADELAYLAGGRDRFADSVMAGLIARGALKIAPRGRFTMNRTVSGASAAERALLGLPDGSRLRVLLGALRTAVVPVERRLIDAGMLMDDRERLRMRLVQTLPLLLLIGFGAIKWMVGQARGKPTGFLTALLLLTAVLALIRFFAIHRRTRSGKATLDAAQAGSDRLRLAVTPGEAGMAVALFGTVVLAGSPWAEYHRLRGSESGDAGSGGGSDSSSSGSGDSGCGGGGCGGCGGGGGD